MSEFWYNGYIKADKIGPKTQKVLDELFLTTDGTVILSESAELDGTLNMLVEFNDHRDGSLLDDLNLLNKTIQSDGAHILEAEISYYGDCDGAYIYDTAKQLFELFDAEEYAIRKASDKVLIEELTRRGLMSDIKHWQEMLKSYVENDLDAAEPDYVREVLFDNIGMTKEETEACGLGYLWEDEEEEE